MAYNETPTESKVMDFTKIAVISAGAAACYFAGRMVTLKKIEKNLLSYTTLDPEEQFSIIENVMAAHGYIQNN